MKTRRLTKAESVAGVALGGLWLLARRVLPEDNLLWLFLLGISLVLVYGLPALLRRRQPAEDIGTPVHIYRALRATGVGVPHYFLDCEIDGVGRCVTHLTGIWLFEYEPQEDRARRFPCRDLVVEREEDSAAVKFRRTTEPFEPEVAAKEVSSDRHAQAFMGAAWTPLRFSFDEIAAYFGTPRSAGSDGGQDLASPANDASAQTDELSRTEEVAPMVLVSSDPEEPLFSTSRDADPLLDIDATEDVAPKPEDG